MAPALVGVDAPSSSAYPMPTLAVDPDRPHKSLPGNMYSTLVGLRDSWIGEAEIKARPKDTVAADSLIPFVERLMSQIPYPTTADQWKSKHEAVKFAEVVLDCIALMMKKCRYLLRHAHAKRLSAYLYQLCFVLDAWSYLGVPHEEGVPAPEDLRRKSVDALLAVFFNLGQSVAVDETTEQSAWLLVKEMLTSLLELSHGLLSSSLLFPIPFPAHVFKGSWARLPSFGRDNTPVESVTIEVNENGDACLLMSLALMVISEAIPAPCEPLVTELARRTLALAQDAYVWALNLSCVRSPSKQCKSVLSIARSATRIATRFDGTASAKFVLDDILLRRVKEIDVWSEHDNLLQEIVQQTPVPTNLDQETTSALLTAVHNKSALRTPSLLEVVVTYVNRNVQHLSSSHLRLALDTFAPHDATPHVSETIRKIQHRLVKVESDETPSDEWRMRIRSGAASITGNELMDEDDKDITTFVHHIMKDVQTYAVNGITDPANIDVLCSRIFNLVSSITRSVSRVLPLFAPLSPLLVALLGPTAISARDAPPFVLQVYRLLELIVQRDNLEWDAKETALLLTLLQNGLHVPTRSVRLSACRSVVQLLDRARSSPEVEHLGQIRTECFSFLGVLAKSNSPQVRETISLALGMIGCTAQGDELNKTVFLLLIQLNHKNLYLRSIAQAQLVLIANKHGLTTSQLANPCLKDIATAVVSQMISQPYFFHEIRRLFHHSSENAFLSKVFPYTLPHLFATRNRQVLDKIASIKGETFFDLSQDNIHGILAECFLLKDQHDFQQAIQFMLNLFSPASGEALTIQPLVISYLVSVILSLVIIVGEDNQQRAPIVIEAFMRVAQALGPKVAPSETQSIVGALLSMRMRGVVNELVLILQDSHRSRNYPSKEPILRGLSWMITEVGREITTVAPQIVACLQSLLSDPSLQPIVLSTLHILIKALPLEDTGPHIGVVTATLAVLWPTFSKTSRAQGRSMLKYLAGTLNHVGDYIKDFASLDGTPALQAIHDVVTKTRPIRTMERIPIIVTRVHSHNHYVVLQALRELKTCIVYKMPQFRALFNEDIFNPMVGDIMSALYTACQREQEEDEPIRLLVYECMGIIGAVDPDRYEMKRDTSRLIPVHSLRTDDEAHMFAIMLISNVLVDLYRSTSDVSYQGHIIVAIEQLAQFCQFDSAVVEGRRAAKRPRARWLALPQHVIEVVSPLVEAGYVAPPFQPDPAPPVPIYPTQPLYRTWLQTWAGHLITRIKSPRARRIFDVFQHLVRQGDAGVAHDLLPNLVLHALLSEGSYNEQDQSNADSIREEIFAVLHDQVHPDTSSSDKRLLSAQAIFALIDHLSNWVRRVRRMTSHASRRERNLEVEEEIMRVDSVISAIDKDLLARAALKCKAYSLSLMNFEGRIIEMRSQQGLPSSQFHEAYERLHELYAALDEPDAMAGVTALIPSPSLEHQIRQHESNGRWTSAQSCWEVRLQESPDNPAHHMGLLRCLRNLGHFDTVRTHVKGLLTRHREWEPTLADFHVESAWMVGDWVDVRSILDTTHGQTPQVMLARLLLSIQSRDEASVPNALKQARLQLGTRLSELGADGHRQTYDALVDLHLIEEIERIHSADISPDPARAISKLLDVLPCRLDLTLPTFSNRERILGMRRTAYQLSITNRWSTEITSSWLSLARMARKSGNLQTAYSAVLQACQTRTLVAQVEAAKLTKATGEKFRALQELETLLGQHGILGNEVIDVSASDEEKQLALKARVLRARWIIDCDRADLDSAGKEFHVAAHHHNTEASWFHYAQFLEAFRESLSDAGRRARNTINTVKAYLKSLEFGSKHIYLSMPRLLTLWLDMEGKFDGYAGAERRIEAISDEISSAGLRLAPWKWYLGFSQLVSRFTNGTPAAWVVIDKIATLVLAEFLDQSIWLFISTLNSTESNRVARGERTIRALLNKTLPTHRLRVDSCRAMATHLLELVTDGRKDTESSLSMSKEYPELFKTAPSPLIIPMQRSLAANVLLTSGNDQSYKPFPVEVPTFVQWEDEVIVMKSLAKPRKITATGSDGQKYIFLGKPKDDLRKDARIMDLNSIINRQLKTRSDLRRRRLHVRTYSVVTLSEECGLVEWVNHTIPIRAVLLKAYDERGIKSWSNAMAAQCEKIKHLKEEDCVREYKTQLLDQFTPPVFHQWFLETFPEPTAWLASRLAYTRTSAVMAMVGHIIGLGDRHLENILLDENTGDAVHVDLNCLFEKGTQLETPERVPFRLTPNIIDGFGVTGVEGVFRITCELSMQLLRDNKDTVLSVLDAFIHDPLIEWKEKKGRSAPKANPTKQGADLNRLARTAMTTITGKLEGRHKPAASSAAKVLETAHLVSLLIEEARSLYNLGRMYGGWAPWH